MIVRRPFPELGDLRVFEVYEYVDEPVLFACRNGRDQLFLAVLSHDDEASRTWFYAPMSQRRFEVVRSGGMDLNGAFRAVEGEHIFVVTAPKGLGDTQSGEWVPVAVIADAYLPLASERLELTTATLPEPEDVAIAATAKQLNCEVLRLRFDFEDRNRTEAPAALLGQLLDTLQQTLTAVGQAVLGKATTRGEIPVDLVNQTRLVVTGTFAGSFGVELHSDAQSDLFGDSGVNQALEQVVGLLEASTSDEALLRILEQLRGRSASKYREFLLRFSGLRSVEVQWGSPKWDRGRMTSLSSGDALRSAATISRMTPDEPVDFEVFGRLVALHARVKTYELWDEEEKRKYSGRVEDDAMEVASHATINEFYRALIRETHAISATGEMETKYHLLRLIPSGSSEVSSPEEPEHK